MSGILESLRAARIIAVVRHGDGGIALSACELLVECGVGALEITTTVPNTGAMIADLRRRFPELLIGAGTLLTAEQAREVLAAGAMFGVSPCWSDAAETVLAADVPWMPGAMTPGEVLHHHQNGAAAVKLSPLDAVGGADFIRSLKAYFPHIEMMPTGGISAAMVQDCIDAGALCVGMSGHLLPFEALERGDADLARRQIKEVLAATGAQAPCPAP